MAFTFYPEELFTKGIVYAEFFDPATDELLGYSRYVADFALAGAMNNGEVEAGPGNALVMMIPDSTRLNITATTADSHLNNMALPIGGTVAGAGIVETTTAITASSATLYLSNASAPYGGENGPICYVLTSSGADKEAVEAQSGVPHTITNGSIDDFTAVSGNTYCVKYFHANSSAQVLTIPALYAPKVVRAHFAVNCYAKKAGGDVLASSLYKVRHYVFPYYVFTNPLEDTLSQTATGTVNLSGTCLSYQEAASEGVCSVNTAGVYGYVVDEIVGSSSSTSLVDGIFFIGTTATVAVNSEVAIPIKYSVNGALTPITDYDDVTFEMGTSGKITMNENVATGVATGTTTLTASVTNATTGVTYTDQITVTVTSA